MKINLTRQKAFTLIEAVVVIGVLAVVIMSVLTMFNNSVKGSATARARLMAVSLATQEMEKIRNLDYNQICTGTGCVIEATQQFLRGGINYTVNISTSYIDDPFDGLDPSDDTPNDYNKVDVKVTWDKFYQNQPVLLSTNISPKGMEFEPTKGALSIKVFDANGVGVSAAKVEVTKGSIIQKYTDDSGNLQFLNLEPGSGYNIVVSKAGYSSDQTYAVGDDFTPLNPDKTVVAGQVTEASFSIDKLSTLTVYTIKPDCSDQNQLPSDEVNLKLEGRKIIGYDENGQVLKPGMLRLLTTKHDLPAEVNDLEWDNYTVSITGVTSSNPEADVNNDEEVNIEDANYLVDYLYRGGPVPEPGTGDLDGDDDVDTTDLVLLINLVNSLPPTFDIAGVSPLSSFNILPGSDTDAKIILETHTENSLLVTVKDSASGNPVGGASVTLTSSSPSYNQTKITDRGILEQTNWQNGATNPGLFTNDPDAYASDIGNLDVTATPGQITLNNNEETYYISQTSDFFATATDRDEIATTANWDTVARNARLVVDEIVYNQETENKNYVIAKQDEENKVTSPISLEKESLVFDKKEQTSFHLAASIPLPRLPWISLTPTSLSFTAAQGAALPSSQPLNIKNTGGGILNWSVSDNCTGSDWLNENPFSGTTGAGMSSNINVQPNTTDLTPSTYNCTITVNSTNADNAPQTVSVTYTVNPPAPHISLSPTSLSFTADKGKPLPAAKSFAISNTTEGSSDLIWSISESPDCTWLNETPSSGTTAYGSPSSVSVRPTTTNLSEGVRSCNVVVSSADNSPQTVTVTYTITVPELAVTYISPGIIQTLQLNDEEPGNITSAKLDVTENKPAGTNIEYYLSADDGTNFESVTPGTTHIFTKQGSKLKFKAVLSANTFKTSTPVLDDINIEYKTEYYSTPDELTSSIFQAESTSEYQNLTWEPTSQDPLTGQDSVKFHIASSANQGGPWTYVGPDGTASTFYNNPLSSIWGGHENKKYIRYKLYISTEDFSKAPIISYVSMDYTVECSPPGQVFFKDIPAATYTLQVTKQGYNPYSMTIQSLSGYNQREVLMTAE